jgi:hypothetical protein
MLKISEVTAQLAASLEGLGSIELVTYSCLVSFIQNIT